MKKGQAWGFDFVIGSLFFIAAIIIFYFFSVNLSSDNEEVFSKFNDQAVLISDSLLSEGLPADWDSSNVVRIGLFGSDGKIDEAKLANFYELATSDYSKTRALFGISDNYFVVFTPEIAIDGSSVEFIGAQSAFYNNKVQSTRIAAYNGTIYTLKVFVWD